MGLIRSLVSAFACFSRIPVPHLAWRDDSMRYMMGLFPLVGAVEALFVMLWWLFCDAVGVGVVVRAAGMLLVPVLTTGGIHMDGFCDVIDAVVSQAEPVRKREILKDPHVGAFAVIGVVSYMLAYFAIATELPLMWQAPALMGCVYVMERALSALSTMVFPKNANEGMMAAMRASADKRVAAAMDVVLYVAAAAVAVWASPAAGGVLVAATLAWFGIMRWFSMRSFGGMSGDLAGFFLQVCEIVALTAVVVMAKAVGL